MTDPTIDEMLAWVSVMEEEWTRKYLPDPDEPAELNDPHRHAKAIRAILEQHRGLERITRLQQMVNDRTELEAIRAFVERVEIQFKAIGRNRDFSDAMRDELAAMEKESE